MRLKNAEKKNKENNIDKELKSFLNLANYAKSRFNMKSEETIIAVTHVLLLFITKNGFTKTEDQER